MLSNLATTENGLIVPTSYLYAHPDEIEENTGGCGPGGLGDWLVPDNILGENIRPACKIHDWMYYKGITEEDRFIADSIFLQNMLIIVSDGGVLDIAQERICFTYYQAVRHGGESSFNNGYTPAVDDIPNNILEEIKHG